MCLRPAQGHNINHHGKDTKLHIISTNAILLRRRIYEGKVKERLYYLRQGNNEPNGFLGEFEPLLFEEGGREALGGTTSRVAF
jgi:hypothetical protein